MKYRAFISYSQQDKAWAEKLHLLLERYRVPLGVVADIDAKSRRIGRVFRDDDEMEASTSLGEALEQALDQSETLVVLCSPNSAKSEWVEKEVRRFKQLERGRVFAVIIDGTPNSNDASTECFCPSLKYKVNADGELTNIEDEPLAPDIRKENLAKIKTRLVAGILNISFDQLWQREQRRKKRNIAIAFSASTVIALALCVGLIINARSQNSNQATELLVFVQHALQASETAALEPDRGATAERALRFSVLAAKHGFLNPAVANTKEALIAGVSNSRALAKYDFHGAPITHASFLGDSPYVISASNNGKTYLWNYKTGAIKSELLSGQNLIEIVSGGQWLLSRDTTNTLSVFERQENELISIFTKQQVAGLCAALSADATKVAICTPTGGVEIYETTTHTLIRTVTENHRGLYKIAFNQDASALLTTGIAKGGMGTFRIDFNAYSILQLWNIETGLEIHIGNQTLPPLQTKIRPASAKAKLINFSANAYSYFYLFDDGTYQYGSAPPMAQVGFSGYPRRPIAFANKVSSDNGYITDAQFYGGGDFITASQDSTVRVWLLQPPNPLIRPEDAELFRLEGHSGAVNVVSTSADFTRAITGGNDGSLRLWDVTNLQDRETFLQAEQDELLAAICDPVTGYLRGSLGQITEDDIIAAPQLKGRKGNNVCRWFID